MVRSRPQLMARIALACLLVLGASSTSATPDGALLKLKADARIVLLGNGLAEGLSRYGYLETALTCAYADNDLVVRNLGWSGDQVGKMDREPGFGDLDERLAWARPDVIFAFFGLNESFGESTGLGAFQDELRDFIRARRLHFYNGKAQAGLVFVSPVPYEQLHPEMPDAEILNSNLQLYTSAMRDICLEESVMFLDVFTSLAESMESASHPITTNGIHLNQYGYWLLSKAISVKLGLISHEGAKDLEWMENLRGRILRKNQLWRDRWRPLNSQFVFGERKEPYGVVSFPGEMEELDRILAKADADIWKAVKPSIMSIWMEEPDPLANYEVPDMPLEIVPPSPVNAASYRTPEESLKAFRTGEGIEVSLWASEVDMPLANPMEMRFDDRGRLWVACCPTWPHPFPGQMPEDYLMIIEDEDWDHRADRHTIFASGLTLPTGWVNTREGVIVGEQRNLVVYRDRDDDGQADAREVLLPGFGVGDVRHGLQGLDWEPEGSLWFCQGELSYSHLETPMGPRSVTGAAMVRLQPRTLGLEVVALDGLRNPRGRSIGASGQSWIHDTETRNVYNETLLRLVPENRPVLAMCRMQHPGIWDGLVLDSLHFPEVWRGVYLRNQTEAFQGIRAYDPVPYGASYVLQRREISLLKSSDSGFRPVDMEIGPDGALYVLDAYNPLFDLESSTMHDPRRAHSHGRIWRVTAKGRQAYWKPFVRDQPVMDLLEMLLQPSPEARTLARLELQERDPEVVLPMTEEWFWEMDVDEEGRDLAKVELLRLYRGFGEINQGLLEDVMDAAEPESRKIAAEILVTWYEDLFEFGPELLQKLMEDVDPSVRLAALAAAQKIGTLEAGDIARLARHYTMDERLQLAYNAVTNNLGTTDGSPPGKRAEALAKSSDELVGGEMTPYAASVLFGRDSVGGDGLVRAATVLGGEHNLDMTSFLLHCLEDPTTPNAELRNVLELLPKADGWTLHYASPQLHELAQHQPRDAVRKGAYAALLIGAATSDTFEWLLDEVRAMGGLEYTALLAAAEVAVKHESVKPHIAPLVEEILARNGEKGGVSARFVQVFSPLTTEFRFLELEVFVAEENVALGKDANQLAHPASPAWWVDNAKAGVNGKTTLGEEPEVGAEDVTPLRGVAVGGPATAEQNLWWGVDLGKDEGEQWVDRLVLYPSPEGFETPWLRFDLRNFLGERVWSAEVPTLGTKPIEVTVNTNAEELETARKLASLLGEDFRKRLEGEAEKASTVEARFHAMRALTAMGNPPEKFRIRQVEVVAQEDGTVRPDKVLVSVKQPVELIFVNDSLRPAKLVILDAEEAEQTSEEEPAESEPETEPVAPVVLDESELVPLSNQTLLRFHAPEERGKYPIKLKVGEELRETGSILYIP